MNKVLFLLFLIVLGLSFSYSVEIELKNKELKETVSRQEKAIKSLENQIHPIPQYLDSIPDFK